LKINAPEKFDVDGKELETMKEIHSDLVNVLFNRKDVKSSRKSSLKKSTSKPQQPCQVCLDRGNTTCKGLFDFCYSIAHPSAGVKSLLFRIIIVNALIVLAYYYTLLHNLMQPAK